MIVIDLKNCSAKIDNKEIRLTPTFVKILSILKKDKYLTSNEIDDIIFENKYHSRVAAVHILKIRRRLGENIILSHKRMAYKLNNDVIFEDKNKNLEKSECFEEIIDFIKNWNGEIDTILGKILYQKIKEFKWTDKNMIDFSEKIRKQEGIVNSYLSIEKCLEYYELSLIQGKGVKI